MLPDRVSPAQGHEPLARRGVPAAPAPSVTRSPILFSRYRGPFALNLAETEEERKAREEAERKKKEDDDKQSNFRKVQEAREAADARAEAAEKKLREREEADKKAAEAKLAEEKKFEELAAQREAETKAASAEAAKEKAGREAAEKELAEFKAAQQKDLDDLLAALPEDARKALPIDDSMTVPQRLKIVKHAKTMLDAKEPDPVGGGVRKGTSADQKTRLKELIKKPRLTEEEQAELAAMSAPTT